MDDGIDFSDDRINKLKMYGGAGGSKIGITHQGEEYMLKFPPKSVRSPNLSYKNSCISEHAACCAFEILGIEAQAIRG